MAIKEDDGTFSLYRILTVKTSKNFINLSGINFGSDELDGYVVQDIRPQAEEIEHLLERMFEGVGAIDWEMRYYQREGWIPEITDTFYYVTIREALKQLQSNGAEFTFSCDVTSQGVTKNI